MPNYSRNARPKENWEIFKQFTQQAPRPRFETSKLRSGFEHLELYLPIPNCSHNARPKENLEIFRKSSRFERHNSESSKNSTACFKRFQIFPEEAACFQCFLLSMFNTDCQSSSIQLEWRRVNKS